MNAQEGCIYNVLEICRCGKELSTHAKSIQCERGNSRPGYDYRGICRDGTIQLGHSATSSTLSRTTDW